MLNVLYALLVFCLANGYTLFSGKELGVALVVLIPLFLWINISPSWYRKVESIKRFQSSKMPTERLQLCFDGCVLLKVFLLSTAISVFYQLFTIADTFHTGIIRGVISLFLVIGIEALVFWNGIIRVYCTSLQIGVKWRAIGIACGMVPIVHLYVLWKIISIAAAETRLEREKIILDQKRKPERICATKYPILMVHGVFFRDFRYFNYWGRIPRELEANGAVIYYGNHQSAASVADSAAELKTRMEEICEETGCDKINIIAHSKGGLDCRYAISLLGAAPMVASLTTINTPHRGCDFADYLLDKIPVKTQQFVAGKYNAALRKMGDITPDFMKAVRDLTAEASMKRNEMVLDQEGVYYQSVGSKLNHASSGRFPLNFTHELVKVFDGPNDGLVAEDSFSWGSHYEFLTVNGKRGISHGDMIDLNRENIADFDVREYYVQLVTDLKNKGF
ncbi:MAG: triacylglycerol lipase [Lachnospiraceae bacterium]|nr:triacylglycerol lipase [Lachnospiraceae bacterium]